MTEPWFKKARRRNVLDMHITDYDASFLREFDPKAYADLLALAGAQASLASSESLGHPWFWAGFVAVGDPR